MLHLQNKNDESLEMVNYIKAKVFFDKLISYQYTHICYYDSLLLSHLRLQVSTWNKMSSKELSSIIHQVGQNDNQAELAQLTNENETRQKPQIGRGGRGSNVSGGFLRLVLK